MCTCKPNHAVHSGDGKCYPSKLYKQNSHGAFMKLIYIEYLKISYFKYVMMMYHKQNNSKKIIVFVKKVH